MRLGIKVVTVRNPSSVGTFSSGCWSWIAKELDAWDRGISLVDMDDRISWSRNETRIGGYDGILIHWRFLKPLVGRHGKVIELIYNCAVFMARLELDYSSFGKVFVKKSVIIRPEEH